VSGHPVVLGVADAAAAERLTAMLREAGGFPLLGVASTASDLRRAVDRDAPDLVLVAEDLGPLPAVELVRELSTRHPRTAVVLAVRDPSTRVARAAMEAGARAIVTLPASLEELQTRLTAAAAWSVALRGYLARHGDGDADEPRSARVVAVAGGRGGAGATTVATLLALAAAGSAPDRAVLVDLDLQTGDVPTHLGLVHARTVHDLVAVADDLTSRAVEDTLFVHPTGLRVLLAPGDGERGEEVSGDLVRAVLADLKSRFDVVVVDVGATTTEASAMAVEMADDVLVVVTPDVPGLRSARRLVDLWRRLEICKPDDVLVLVNRASRRDEVQPRLVRAVLGVPVAGTVVPARYRRLEPLLNAGPPEKPADHPLWRPVTAVGRELGVVAPRVRWWHRRPSRRSSGSRASRSRRWWGTARHAASGDRGGGVFEHTFATAMLVLLFLVLAQLLLHGLSALLATHAADRGARRLAVVSPERPEGRREIERAATRNLPAMWRDSARVRVGDDEVAVTLRVPEFLGVASFGLYPATSVTMVEGTRRES